MTISSVCKKLSVAAIAAIVTFAAGSVEAAYGDNGMAARNGFASGPACFSAAGIDPSKSLSASLATR
jgi:hypothetical protein